MSRAVRGAAHALVLASTDGALRFLGVAITVIAGGALLWFTFIGSGSIISTHVKS